MYLDSSSVGARGWGVGLIWYSYRAHVPLCKVGIVVLSVRKYEYFKIEHCAFAVQLYNMCKINTDLLHNTYYLLLNAATCFGHNC